MRINLLLIILTVTTAASSQSLLRGYVTATDVALDSIQVINTERRTFVYTDSKGYFIISAREGTTLNFNGSQFADTTYVVKYNDFSEPVVISLTPSISQLKEVVVNRYMLSGDLNADSKQILIEENFAPQLTFPKVEDNIKYRVGGTKPIYISTNPQLESELSGINFVMIGNKIAKVLGITRKKETPVVKLDFQTELDRRYSDEYFLSVLKIDEQDVNLFLQYCVGRLPPDIDLLEDQNELLLTEFLIMRAEEFAALK